MGSVIQFGTRSSNPSMTAATMSTTVTTQIGQCAITVTANDVSESMTFFSFGCCVASHLQIQGRNATRYPAENTTAAIHPHIHSKASAVTSNETSVATSTSFAATGTGVSP
jgi:hypothetical protein